MTTIDHLILNVNEVGPSVEFHVNVLGFKLEGEDGPFTMSPFRRTRHRQS